METQKVAAEDRIHVGQILDEKRGPQLKHERKDQDKEPRVANLAEMFDHSIGERDGKRKNCQDLKDRRDRRMRELNGPGNKIEKMDTQGHGEEEPLQVF